MVFELGIVCEIVVLMMYMLSEKKVDELVLLYVVSCLLELFWFVDACLNEVDV